LFCPAFLAGSLDSLTPGGLIKKIDGSDRALGRAGRGQPSAANQVECRGIEGGIVRGLLAVSAFIDWINEKIGFVANLLVLIACVVSAGNAMSRYAFNLSSNAWLEVQWYMFAVIVMYGAAYTLKRNEHVRVEILYLMLSERGQLWLDLICTAIFLVPICLLLTYLSWPFFAMSLPAADHPGEISGNAGGLVRWPIKFVLPSGFALLALQGVSEIIKRIAALAGATTVDARYERPLQ
jgi:TRAP-type mannitol/chloroaromatic compound transport system permease small subunit